jgi:GT2 family glycosyltransferase
MIYIILPVHNRKNITELFIKSLVLQTYKDFKLVLVDDGSTDGTDEMVLSHLPESIILKGDGNLWWGGGLHKGYEWVKENATDGSVLLINDDTIIAEDFLQVGANLLNNSEKTLYLAQAYDKNNKHVDSGVCVDWDKLTFNQAKNKEEINCLSTRGLFLTVEDFLDIGGFHPVILPHYLSDYEFTIRA